MHRDTVYHMLCIFDVCFDAFSMVNLALKCTVLNPINRQNIYIWVFVRLSVILASEIF